MSDQVVPGHPSLGLFDAGMIESETGDLFLLGGSDGLNGYKDIYAYNEHYGFYDIGIELPEVMIEFMTFLLPDD